MTPFPLAPTNVCFEGKNGHDAGMTPFPLMSRCDAVISCLAQRLGERLDGGVDYRFIEARIAEN